MAAPTSPPTLNTSQITANSTSNLPPDLNPASLDTIPVLASILTRLQSSPQNDLISSPHQSQPLALSLSQTHSQITSSPSLSNTQIPASTTSAPGTSQDKEKFAMFSAAPLTTKEIPTATDALKHRLQRARAQVAALPDVQRVVAEQEEEIRELEGRIAGQRAALEHLRAMGAAQSGEAMEM